MMAVGLAMMMMVVVLAVDGYDTNGVYGPCSDAKIQRRDGFTLGLAFSSRESFFFNQTQLSPCDRRLGLASNAQFALFRPRVDEISLLTLNSTGSVFSPVLEFQEGTLQNFFWKQDGCASCSGKSAFICVKQLGCAIRTSSCNSHGGPVDCSLSIQLAFSGTDRNYDVLNSWYEVANLKQYSLFNLYSDLKDSLSILNGNIL
ncbi:uncharacterized protein LOC131253663 isoform X2 [Magnolia sinica]|uniref:uncharacterized protein LOC131253663 isoform X2 n=1 Tax=Magnolia sinica TaxID=86752 RepID=UPI00265B279A|nr:uncharacterized protein LOC131253663 isoform X2 [Magnolia sinica]